MKTLNQLSKELNVSKQRIYRYVKAEHLSEVHYDDKVMLVDETLEKKIIGHFDERSKSKEVNYDTSYNELIDVLKSQLEEKDKQIERLQKTLENQQVLTLQLNQKVELLETKNDTPIKRHWWQKKD